MPIKDALRQVREKRGLSQRDIGKISYLSNKTVSAIERGRRQITPDVLSRLAKVLDDPRLYMAVVEEVTGGVLCTPWLDGERVDLHRSSVRLKLTEELQEALDAIRRANTINLPNKSDNRFRTLIHDSLIQLLDVRVAIDHFVAVSCDEYGLSMAALYADHRRKLETKGLVRVRRQTQRAS